MRFDLVKTTSRIVSLARTGSLSQARKLFDEMPQRDTVAWNSIISTYSQLGLSQEALSLFHQLRTSPSQPDHFTFTSILSASAAACSLRSGTKIHAMVVVSGYNSCLPVNNSLVNMYGKCLDPVSAGKVFGEMEVVNEVSWCSILFAYTNSRMFDVAKEVFDSMPKKVGVAWNTMISGLSRCGEIYLCLDLLREFRKESPLEVDQWTYSAVISACTESLELVYGCVVHAVVIKSAWSEAVEVTNAIMSFYAKVGSLDDALEVFKSTGVATQVTWNAAIDAYMKAEKTHEALLTFQGMPLKNVVSWTSMIAGYARNGYGMEALSFFVGMMWSCLWVDDFTLGAVLHACSNLAVLGLGRMIHGCVVHLGFCGYSYVGNGLVNMYAKCGDLEGSIRAFDGIFKKDLVSFNAMLFAFGLHGKANQALKTYEEMITSGIIPDKVTFVGLLMACSHSGLVEKGHSVFQKMTSVYGFAYDDDHVACMVDLLSRGGYLSEAQQLANEHSKTSLEVRASSCEALLGACSGHGELGMGTCLGEVLKSLDPCNEMSYVLQSNLYCVSGQWEEAEMVRSMMVNEGVKKMPGCSWIEVRNNVIAFVAGNLSRAYVDELYETLSSLHFAIANTSMCLIIGFEN